MIRFRSLGLISLVAVGLMGAAASGVTDAYAADKAAAKGPKPPPMVKEAIRLTPEGLRFGMATNEVVDFYGKVLDQDYVAIYKVTPVGPKMKQVDAALADQKAAFPRSEVTFGALPTGIDNTPLRGEYNYNNNETMMSITRQGVTRYFFFASKRLWKVYDAIPLKEGSELGATYKDAIAALTKRFNVAGRVLAEDPAAGRNTTEVDWADQSTHVRAIDRSSENILGLVYEEKGTADRMVAYRASHKDNSGAIDPSIAAATSGGAGGNDPNASAADAYTGKAHAGPPQPSNKKK
jgi:hypothetical protein